MECRDRRRALRAARDRRRRRHGGMRRTDPGRRGMSQTWWYLSRASGIVAWSLLTLAMVWGLLLSTRMFDRRPSPRGLVDLHRFLGGIAVVFVALHVGAIVADSYVHFGTVDVLVPFATGWHPLAVAWGVVAMWILLAVEITSLAMRHIPRRVWHAV